MKKNSFIALLIGLALAAFSLPSCTDLDETVYDKLPADQFGQTKAEVDALMGAAYNTLKGYWPDKFMYLAECGGSMAITPTRGSDWWDGGQYKEFFLHTYTSNTQQIRASWNAAAAAIGTCNATIKVLQESTASDLSTDDKNKGIASMKGLRDFWIYVMMDNWGGIPLVTEYDPSVTPSAAASRQEVFDFLVSDLTSIAEQCPAPSSDYYGKFTTGSAYFLLAKLYLNAEAWGVSASNAYQECINACDKVLAFVGNGYSFPEGIDGWKTNFGISDHSTEAILTITFSESDTQDQNQLMCRTLHYADNPSDASSYSAWNGICAQPDYAKIFGIRTPALARAAGETPGTTTVNDSVYFEDPRGDLSFRMGQRYSLATGDALKTADGDGMLNYTLEVTMDANNARGDGWSSVYQNQGVRCQKWPFASSVTSAMGNHFHIFRLADIYLTKAEALLRRDNGSNSEATELVNKIRNRVGATALSGSATLDDVQKERRLELAWEAWSRQDDIRFGCFEQTLWSNGKSGSINLQRATSEHLRVYPIPIDALQTNQSLEQNPEY